MATTSTDHQEQEAKKEEGLDLKYDLSGLTLNLNDKVASCPLRMPPELPHGFTEHGDDPVLYLDLLASDKGWIHSFKLMKEIVHPNILHARLIHKNELQTISKKGSERASDYWGLVEQYTGILFDYLKRRLGVPSSVKSGKVLLPTDSLCSIVRQLLDGFEHLMFQGYYHGDFALNCTYYLQKPNGDICVKLAGFKKRSEKKTLCQKEDIFSLADELDQLSSIAKDLNIAADVKKSGLHFDTYQIDDLAKKLKQVTEANLHQIYPKIKRHPFFWVEHHRKNFFIYEVAVALKKEDRFRSLIEGCEDLCGLPWNMDDYDGFLAKMNKYRRDIGKRCTMGPVCGLLLSSSLDCTAMSFCLRMNPIKLTGP